VSEQSLTARHPARIDHLPATRGRLRGDCQRPLWRFFGYPRATLRPTNRPRKNGTTTQLHHRYLRREWHETNAELATVRRDPSKNPEGTEFGQ